MNSEQNLIPTPFNGPQLKSGIPAITIQEESPEDDLENVLWIDFDSGEDSVDGMKCAGPQTYVISPVSEQNFFSDKYLNCIGTVGIGRDKTSGTEIAFLGHLDPAFILHRGPEATERLTSDLRAALNDLVARSEKGTVEVVLLGGNDTLDDPSSKKSTDYQKSIEAIQAVVQEVMGFTPTILSGPNHLGGAIDITVITAERKIVVGK